MLYSNVISWWHHMMSFSNPHQKVIHGSNSKELIDLNVILNFVFRRFNDTSYSQRYIYRGSNTVLCCRISPCYWFYTQFRIYTQVTIFFVSLDEEYLTESYFYTHGNCEKKTLQTQRFCIGTIYLSIKLEVLFRFVWHGQGLALNSENLLWQFEFITDRYFLSFRDIKPDNLLLDARVSVK